MSVMFVMNVMHERKVLIGLTHHSHNDFLTTLHGLAAPASTDVKPRRKQINHYLLPDPA